MTTTKTVAPAGSYRACIRCRAAGFCIHPQAGQGVYRVQARRLRAGETLQTPEQSPHTFFVLCEGTARSCTRRHDGSLQITDFHLPGELVSFETMGDPAMRHDAVALEPCTVREITCQCDPEPNAVVWGAMLGLLRDDAAHRRARLRPFAGRQTAAQRLSAWLGNLVERCRQRGLDPRVMAFRMTRAEIGSYLGLAKETVCRLFVQYQRDGWVEQRGRRFLVRRPEAFLR